MDLKARTKKLKTDIPDLFLASKDSNTPIVVLCNCDCDSMGYNSSFDTKII